MEEEPAIIPPLASMPTSSSDIIIREQDANFANSLEQVQARSMMPDEATIFSSLPELTSLPSFEEQQKGNMDYLLPQISFDHELCSLPPLDFTIPEDVLFMTADEFFSDLED